MSWLDAFFVGISTVQIAGSPLPQRPTLNYVSGVTGADNAALNRTDLTVTGGGGGSGLVVNATVTANTALTRTNAQVVQPVNSGGGTVQITAWGSPQHGDIIMVPDENGSYATNAMTFNGNGAFVENPYDAGAVTASTCVVSIAGAKPGWIYLTPANVWRSFMSC